MSQKTFINIYNRGKNGVTKYFEAQYFIYNNGKSEPQNTP